MIDLDRILPEQHPGHADAWLADQLAAVARRNSLGTTWGDATVTTIPVAPTSNIWGRLAQEATPC